MAPATNGCLACRLETPMPVDPQKALGNEVGSNSALIGNDGALKADTRISPRKWGPHSSESGSCGASYLCRRLTMGAVKSGARQTRHFAPLFSEK